MKPSLFRLIFALPLIMCPGRNVYSFSNPGVIRKAALPAAAGLPAFLSPSKSFNPFKMYLRNPETKWRANMYRIDYDDKMLLYLWAEFENTFHDFRHFGTFNFE